MRQLLPAALGIEILCISAAEIGGNAGLYLFGFNTQGLGFSYMLVYALAGFTTFAAILGRYRNSSAVESSANLDESQSNHTHSCNCCSILEESTDLSFLVGLKHTLVSFGRGISRIICFHKEHNKRQILKTSLILLVTAEKADASSLQPQLILYFTSIQ